MATVGGVLKRICDQNIRGQYAGEPWQWAPDEACQRLEEELAKLNVQAEEINVGRINSVGEFVINIGVAAAQQLIAFALQRGGELIQRERDTFFAYEEEGTAAGIGPFRDRVYLPLTRLGEAQGRNLLISRDYLRTQGLSDNDIEYLLERMRRVDADRNLGLFTRVEFEGGLL
jgi:hypothetical protein